MPNITKLTPELLLKIQQMAEEGQNNTKIAKEIGHKRQTIDYWVKKYKIKTCSNSNMPTPQQKLYIECIKKTGSPKQASKASNLKSNGNYIIKKFNLQEYVNSRGSDKILSFKEAESRLPNKTDKVIGFEKRKYIIQTKDGYTYYKSSSKLYQGDPRGKSGKLIDVEYIRKRLLEIDYELINDSYSIKRKALKARCLKCNNIRQNRFDLFFKQRCPICSINGVSLTEIEIKEWVESLGFNTEKYRFKGKTKGKEIDIYISKLNLGIEYCGLYWHDERHKKNNKYHYNKMKQANDSNIRLITIFEDEWLNRKNQVKNFIKGVLNICNYKIFARKCCVKEIDKKTAHIFLNENHIQGKTCIKITFGLYYNDELVGVITGNKHHRQNINSFVFNRLVFKDGYKIIGGASKLLKRLINYAKDNGYKNIISWSDNRWSEGNVYKKIGFKLDAELKPDYSYVVGNKRESKQSNKKKDLIRKGAIGTMNNTEKELANSLGCYRIWDCGKKRWKINL